MSGVPTSIGRYTVERLLGQGAMGSVFLGRDLQLDRAVAIKTVRHVDLEEKRLTTFLERFKNEARAAARLSHPAIVAVYDVGEDEAMGPYLVFEYVAGSTLKQILRARGALPPELTIRLGRQLAAALDTAHAAGVIHRDVKPDNILMTASDDAKLADFGVARVPDAALTKEGQFLGTPCYAAPETLGGGRYGPHSDLFSFAAVLYETVTAMRAFPGDDAISVAHRVVHDDPDPPSKIAPGAKIPKEVDRVLMRALAKDDAARYGSASELIESLRAAYVAAKMLEDDSTGAQPLAAPSPAHPEKGGGGLAFALVLGGLLAVGTALVLAFGDFGASGLDGVDAGVLAIASGAADAGQRIDVRGPAIVDQDAESTRRRPDAGIDAGRSTAHADAGIGSMSAFDREEAAKDQVAVARERLAEGNVEGAASAVARARLYDSENGDIGALEARIRAARAEPAVP